MKTTSRLEYGMMVRLSRDLSHPTPSIFMFIDEQESGYDWEKYAEVRVIKSNGDFEVGDHLLLDPDSLVPLD